MCKEERIFHLICLHVVVFFSSRCYTPNEHINVCCYGGKKKRRYNVMKMRSRIVNRKTNVVHTGKEHKDEMGEGKRGKEGETESEKAKELRSVNRT